MSHTGNGWAPPRPDRVATVFDPRPERVTERSDLAPASLPPVRPGVFARRSPGARLLFAYAAGAAVVALVTGAGAATQPVYGSEAPFGGTTFADMRTAPTETGWSLDLADEFAPGLDPDCLGFRAGDVDDRHELVTATVPSATATGQNALCAAASPAIPGRLSMVDPVTGRVVWRRSLAGDLETQVYSLVWHASRGAGVVVVGVDGSRGAELLSLDIDTGRIVSRTAVERPDEAINFAVSGHLVVSVVPDVGGAVDTYTLRRTEALSTTLWSRSVSSVLLPQLLPDRFVLPLPTGTTSVDGVTGRETRWGTDLRTLQGVRVTGERLVAQTVPRGVGLSASVVSLDSTGRTRWSSPAPAISGLAVSRRCVIVSTGSDRVTCLDPATGRERWASDVAGSIVGTPSGSRTGDTVLIGPVHARDESLLLSALDGDTGRVRFETTVPRGSVVVGEAEATGYALATSSSTGASSLTAFDLDTGRTLWTLLRAELAVWGGHPVEIARGGVVHQLTVGRTRIGHDMLVG